VPKWHHNFQWSKSRLNLFNQIDILGMQKSVQSNPESGNCVCIWIIKDITNPGIDSFNINMDYRRCKKTFSALLLGQLLYMNLINEPTRMAKVMGVMLYPWIFPVMELQVVYNHFYSRLIEASHPIRCMGFALDTIFRLDVLQRTTLQHHLLVGGFKHCLFSIIYGIILPID
jgi:hypothetical protein